ncbi:MAG: ribonuclease P protein component [Betaproteobacteria bacterium]|nr:ribonuclease P protein component [Betaproteobacteria bacterium]
MTNRKSRLKSAGEFERVFREGKRRQGRWLGLWFLPSATESARLGLVVSKRCAKRAVDRNTVKRILREVFRDQALSLPGIDVVFRLRQQWPSEERKALAEEARGMLRGLLA